MHLLADLVGSPFRMDQQQERTVKWIDFIEKVKKDLAFGSRDGCYGQACRDCEYYVNESCSYHKTEVMRDALVVIESQQKEIKRLEEMNQELVRLNGMDV